MEQNLEHTISLLTRTPAALNSLLRDLPETWTMRNEGGNSWNAFDVVGHLIHGERTDWIPRAKMILEFGESRAFEPFDRLAQERESRGKSLGELLDEFTRVRAENLTELKGLKLGPEDLARRGRHPSLGVVTLSELLATWGAHDLTHLHQISRIMAHQYREAVGPWSKFLGVMQCAGHSAAGLSKLSLTRFVLRLVQGAPALFRQLANQPVRFQRIAEPGRRPAMRDAGAHQSGVDMLAVSIEQRQLTAGLRKPAEQIAPLRGVGRSVRSLFAQLGRIRLPGLIPFKPAHFTPFSLLHVIELLFNAVEREMFAIRGAPPLRPHRSLIPAG